MRPMPGSARLAFRSIAHAFSPAGENARVSTLIFHRVLTAPDPLSPGEVTDSDFECVLSWCKALFNVIPLADAVAGLKSGRLPARPLVITFDDGYADNHDLAAPILRRLGLPATFFIASGYLDGGRMFNDDVACAVGRCSAPELDLTEVGLGRFPLVDLAERRTALSTLLPAIKVLPIAHRADVVARILELADVQPPASLMMSSEQVASLKRQGFEIGAHTVSHPILAHLDRAAARSEIRCGRLRLEQITGAPVRFFAYPNGRPGEDFSAETVQLVRELGFDAACTTTPGVATRRSDLFQLPRFTPWDRTPLRFALRMVRNLMRSRPLTVDPQATVDRQPAAAA